MSKYRIYDLAKEFHTESKVVLNVLARNDIKVKSHSSTVGDEERNMLAKIFSGEKARTVVKAERTTPVKTAPKAVKTEQTTKKDQPMAKKVPQHAESRPAVSANRNDNRQHANVGSRSQAERNHSSSERTSAANGHNRPNDNRSQGRRFHDEHSRNLAARPHQNTNASAGHTDSNHQHTAGNNGTQHRSDNNSRGTGSSTNNTNNGRNQQHRNSAGGHMNNNFHNNHNGGRYQSNGNRRGGRNRNRNRRDRNQPQVPKVEIARPKHIKVGESIAVKDLASKMSYTATELIKKLMLMGVMATINQEIDYDTAALVASEFGVTTEELPPEVDPTEIPEVEDDPRSLVLRPPVVTVMGHVDHGKTSLLDSIRKTSVSAHEAGGITQHIGAYQVNCKGKKIVFLDTPGHEAFTAMRARGAQVTDIAVLVVAADDGVMPQTIEAIHHAKSAKVPIIVAINKIDKPGANPEHVKQELMEQGLVSEEWGGDVIMAPVSAKKKIGISELLENILLLAEVSELKANPNRDARGVIIEAQLDKGRGSVATVLIQNGTLRIGDTIIAGTTYGKVRAMINDRGENVRKAGPSVPVEVLGLNGVPEAGDQLAVLDEKQARSIAEHRIERQRTQLIHKKKVSLDDLFQQIQAGSIKDLNIVIKADVQGSVEALTGSLLSLNKNEEVRVSIVHSGVGAVNESDVMLASASNAIIIAFNVRPDANARKVADTEDVDIRTYRVIYDALNDVKDAMSGMLAPKYKEVIQGRVEIRKVMHFSKALVAGSYVLEGKIMNNSKIRIIRDNIEVFDGAIDSLRRFKDDVKEVAAGYECGISIVDYRDFHEGDVIEAYTMEEVKTSITEANRKTEAKKKAEAAKKAEQEAKEDEAKED
jgi:translation initiation factor IF-2